MCGGGNSWGWVFNSLKVEASLPPAAISLQAALGLEAGILPGVGRTWALNLSPGLGTPPTMGLHLGGGGDNTGQDPRGDGNALYFSGGEQLHKIPPQHSR